jgi:tRNA nucleotidyltransferase/poly(A) polymerase
MKKEADIAIPRPVVDAANALIQKGYQAYLVGGSVRDMARGIAPKDYDIATDALPEDVLKIFPDGKYENSFGTVLVKTGSDDETVKILEVTTFRIEGKYSDFRRPDDVTFAKTIEEDLSRRDFTVNALDSVKTLIWPQLQGIANKASRWIIVDGLRWVNLGIDAILFKHVVDYRCFGGQ